MGKKKVKIEIHDARCKHDTYLTGPDICVECEWEAQCMTENVPFTVECINDQNSPLREGHTYIVLGIVKDGCLPSSRGPGLLLAGDNEHKSVHPTIFGCERFKMVKVKPSKEK